MWGYLPDPMSQAGSWGHCRGTVTVSLPPPSSSKAGSVVLVLLLPWAKLILKVFQKRAKNIKPNSSGLCSLLTSGAHLGTAVPKPDPRPAPSAATRPGVAM